MYIGSVIGQGIDLEEVAHDIDGDERVLGADQFVVNVTNNIVSLELETSKNNIDADRRDSATLSLNAIFEDVINTAQFTKDWGSMNLTLQNNVTIRTNFRILF